MPQSAERFFLTFRKTTRCGGRLCCGFSLLVAAVLLLTSAAFSLAKPQQESAERPASDANRLAREVVQNELNAETNDRTLWRYRKTILEDGADQLMEVVETKQGEIHRLLATDGKPLNATQTKAEDVRIRKLLADPEQFQQQQKDRAQDARQEQKLLRMLPEAFLFEYDGMKGNLVGLKFTPNPNFHPSGREGSVFHHMEGTIWVDPDQKRLAEIDGHLTTEVKFWGGLLGHLDKGGTFSVKQEDMGSGHWEMTLLNVQMDGKALFFKTIAVREREVYSNFELLPDSTTLQKAAEILRVDTSS